jgi:hypothetical protein
LDPALDLSPRFSPFARCSHYRWTSLKFLFAASEGLGGFPFELVSNKIIKTPMKGEEK